LQLPTKVFTCQISTGISTKVNTVTSETPSTKLSLIPNEDIKFKVNGARLFSFRVSFITCLPISSTFIELISKPLTKFMRKSVPVMRKICK
jgi:hypothetical protein